MPAYGRGIGYTANPPIDPRLLDSGGFTTIDRAAATVSTTMSTQTLRVAIFDCPRDMTVGSIGTYVAATGAGATPTLIRFGIWAATAAGALTSLLGSTANDTTLLPTANTRYTKALQANVTMTRGTLYAAGLLVVTGATAPTIPSSTNVSAAPNAIAPCRATAATGQSDLPSTIGSVFPTGVIPLLELIPA